MFSFENALSPDAIAKLQQLSQKFRLLLRVTTELVLLDSFSLNSLFLRLLATACASPSSVSQPSGRLDSDVEHCCEGEYPTLAQSRSAVLARVDTTKNTDGRETKTQIGEHSPSWTEDSALALSRLQAVGSFAKKASLLLQSKQTRLASFENAVKQYLEHQNPKEMDKYQAAGQQSRDCVEVSHAVSTEEVFQADKITAALNVQDVSAEEVTEAITELATGEMLPEDVRSEVSFPLGCQVLRVANPWCEYGSHICNPCLCHCLIIKDRL